MAVQPGVPGVRVRVKDTGAHITIPEELYKADESPYQKLKEDAYGPDGEFAPVSYPDTSATTATSNSQKES